MNTKILELVNNRDFQNLTDYYGKRTIFETLKVERKENRHSAFIAWWLNPKAEHGLNDAPLKLLLRLFATKDMGHYIFDSSVYAKVLAGNYNVELMDGGIEVEKCVNNDKKNRIDIWMVLRMTFDTDDEPKELFYPLAIENKVYSNEGENQTERYWNAICQNLNEYPKENRGKGIAIFLTPNGTKPKSEYFVPIAYQELLTYVIEPLSEIVNDGQRNFVDSYIRSLSCNFYEGEKTYNVLAISRKERKQLADLYNSHKDLFDKAFLAAFPEQKVCKIIGKERMQELTLEESDMELLYELWAAHENLFMVMAYHAYEGKGKELEKLFKPGGKDTSKYIVRYNGNEIFPNKSLSKSKAALAIFKAYLMENPQTTLEEMRKAFPCDRLNQYYSGRYYQDLFYPSCPDTMDEGGYEILQYTAGKHIGKKARAKWDFYLDDDQLLHIDGGRKRAMCVKFWRKRDFESLAEWVSENYKFIDVQKCL